MYYVSIYCPLECSLSYVDAGSVTEVSQVHVASIFMVKVSRVRQDTKRQQYISEALATLPLSTQIILKMAVNINNESL
jgi:hypothetical protein